MGKMKSSGFTLIELISTITMISMLVLAVLSISLSLISANKNLKNMLIFSEKARADISYIKERLSVQNLDKNSVIITEDKILEFDVKYIFVKNNLKEVTTHYKIIAVDDNKPNSENKKLEMISKSKNKIYNNGKITNGESDEDTKIISENIKDFKVIRLEEKIHFIITYDFWGEERKSEFEIAI